VSVSVDETVLVIEPLGSHHNRAAFSCAEPALDSYLERQASQDIRRRVAQVFVALGDAPGKITGYYGLSAASFEKDELPPVLAKPLPHYPVPAAILGRLAVDRACQKRGLGETLLLDAIRRVVRASATLAVYAIIVDAKNDRAVAFYQRYGFRTFAGEQRRLFLPLETFEKLEL
jgi:ribosomal protein S18 acetylase RimI-like enzyme